MSPGTRGACGPVAVLLLLLAFGCGPAAERSATGPGPRGSEDPQRVIATTRTGTITAADIERYVGREGLAQGLDPELSAEERYADVARRLVLEQLLWQKALATGVDRDPEFLRLERHHRRLLYSQHFLQSLPVPEPITEAELRQHFELVKPRLDQKEMRRVSHIFLRYGEQDREPMRERLHEIRQQALAGHAFELLAREHSESETRHRDGLLGFVERGVFPPDFDRIAFSLTPGMPSEVLSTADGAHLLYVHNVLEARDVAFEDVRELLRRELLLEQMLRSLQDAAAALPEPEASWRAAGEQIPDLLRNAPDGDAVLRIGDVEITVGELREQIRPLFRQLGELAGEELAIRIVDDLRAREIIFQHMLRREETGERLEIPREEAEAARRRQLFEHYARRLMIERLRSDAERLERYRAENALRFSTPLRLQIERLEVPPGADGSAVMARLEGARNALDAGDIHLRELAVALDGQVADLGLLALFQLGALDPTAARFAPLLGPGEHSPPYAFGPVLTMFSVVRRIEPEALPLAQVGEQVIDDYLEHHGAQVFREIADEWLAEAEFELHVRSSGGP
ncbi:MAG: peptidylprolyl isomerase [Holophagales bacterium]|nr:peptidylprolyl isomerase [Holophagales bacterium]